MKRFLSTFVLSTALLCVQGCYTQLKWFHTPNESTNINSNFYDENDYLDYKSNIIYDNSLFSYDYNRFNRNRRDFFGFRQPLHYPYWDRNSFYLGHGSSFYSPYGLGYKNTFYPSTMYSIKPVYTTSNDFRSRNWDKRFKSSFNNNESSNLKTIRFSPPSMTKVKGEKKKQKNKETFGNINSKDINKRPNITRTRDNYPTSRSSYTSPRRNVKSSSSSSSNSSPKRVSRRR